MKNLFKVHRPVSREKAKDMGFKVWNQGPHIPIEIKENGNFTITVKHQDEVITLAFVYGTYDPQGGPDFLNSIDIDRGKLKSIKTIGFHTNKLDEKSEGEFVAILLAPHHYHS